MDGIHLILKSWPANKALQEISFDTSTFFIQIHGLPPNLMHADNARRIGRLIGDLHEASIGKKSVVGNRFLRIRVDILVGNPIPEGYFQKKEQGEDLWIQFKLERLPYFCYKSGLLSHVTGKCSFAEPAMVTIGNGISTRLYGPWIRAEYKGESLAINPPEEPRQKRLVKDIRDAGFQSGEHVEESLLGFPKGG